MHPNELERLKTWIGRTERREDVVTQRLVAELCATLNLPAPVEPASAPITLHWCLAPEIEHGEKLGSDGHAALGHFLPPVPLGRRMWVGGDFTLHAPLHVNDRVIRTSRIADIELKTGRTGALCFVTVAHELAAARGLAVSERQVLVYRDSLSAGDHASIEVTPPATRKAAWQQRVTIDSVLLFRYSALTFNSHRIHYDVDYCRRAGLDGLLVHGPLQASLLAEFAASIRRGRAPTHFSYRAVRPLIASDAPLTLNAVETDSGLDLWAATPAGLETMTALAH